MKLYIGMALGLVAGIGIGTAGVQGLNAQTKPLVYYVSEIDVSNPEAYAKEFLPKSQASIKAAGGRYVAMGGPVAAGATVTGFDGEPPKNRVVIHVWDSLEKLKAWHSSAEYQAARTIGNKYAKFRSFALEGLPQ